MKLIFFGTSEFAVPALEALAEAPDIEIPLVVTEEAKEVGRTRALTHSPVFVAAEKLGLPTYTPRSLKDAEVQKHIIARPCDVMVVASYGKIIPQEIFNFPPLKMLNLHGSLLPLLRGAAPIQYALLEGHTETGITIIQIDEIVDHGPILSQEKISIEPGETYLTLESKLAKLAAKMLVRDLPGYATKQLPVREQDHELATFTEMISKSDGKVDWRLPAERIYNQWRAFIKWPGIFTFAGELRLNLREVIPGPVEPFKREAGEISEQGGRLYVETGAGSLEIIEIQPEGKRVLSAAEFINGYRELLGKKLQ